MSRCGWCRCPASRRSSPGTQADRAAVLGEGLPRISLEAASPFGWGDIVGASALHIGIDHYGASAPAEALAELFGLTPEAVADRIAAHLG